MHVKPFKGILYNTNLVKLLDVVTPPYDKISNEKKDLYAEKSPYNMIHLILPSSYSEAASLTQTWLKNDILKEVMRLFKKKNIPFSLDKRIDLVE